MIPKQHEPQPDLSAPDAEPLPPLPDGGLARTMPDWLRAEPPPSPLASPVAATDPAGFITEDDLPDWLRQLSPGYSAPSPLIEAPPSQASPTAAPVPPAVLPAFKPSPAPASPPRRMEPEPVARFAPEPGSAPSDRRRVIVAVAGVLLLAIGVLAYLYATRGGF